LLLLAAEPVAVDKPVTMEAEVAEQEGF